MTAAEAAGRLGVSRPTLYAYVSRGLLRSQATSGPSRARGYAREDVNQDGRVDILDAFQLAREIQSGAALPTALDFNGDGVVDRSDADVIASEAVSLEKKGGRS